MTRIGACAGVLDCLALCSGAAPIPANTMAWLKAFNAGDAKALSALGDDSTDFDRDLREETGGLDFVRTESDDGRAIRVLVHERLSPQLWHVTLTRDPHNSARFAKVRFIGEPMSSAKEATAALDSFAG